MNLTLDQQHNYHLNGVEIPGVSRILDASGFSTPYPEGDYKLRGTAVHSATAFLDQGLDVRVGPGIDKYLLAYRSFLKEFPIQWVEIEKMIFHPGLLYAGTVDRFGLLGRRRLVLDIKTGTPPLKRLGLQLAAYAHILAPDALRWGLELKDDATYKIHVCDNSLDYPVWVGLVNRYRWERV